ncbi:phage baseplate protein [Alkalicoccobacillus plakortidis]|uniref:P68 RBP/TagC-like beta-propeller domain-containing protein n=1 Tax=Alkalicoccobacillus plakortidis TaxID=444060 RepID=A0ABT0XJM4_9BACI|nr:hypothetical protein [Alkalicoccobacillus plakortidis]MCM2675568.1 hypothetical protein [Alkalicoccobacillus plakortidis]
MPIKNVIQKLANSVRGEEKARYVRDSIADGMEETAKLADETEKLSKDTQFQQEVLDKKYKEQIANATDITEIKDYHVSRTTGKSFGTMGERADDNENELIVTNQTLGVLDDIEHEFDLFKYEPYFFAELVPMSASVMQWFGIDERTENLFATQVHSTTSGNNEHYVLSQMTPNGELIDYMIIKDGGHGTTVGLEWEDDVLYVWSNLNIVDGNNRVISNELVRFPYKPNTGIGSISGIERFKKFNSVYTTPTIDPAYGFITLRYSRNGRQVVELRKLSDIKEGVDNLLGEVIVSSDIDFMQGVTSDGYDMYWYSGSANGTPHQPYLAQYDFKTGQEVARKLHTFGAENNGKFIDDFREPEGVFFYTDPVTKQRALLAGITVGGMGRRRHKVYSYGQRGSINKLMQYILSNPQLYAMTKSDGSRKNIPANAKSLAEITKPGHYYLSIDDSLRLTDHPDPGNAGWFLDVLPGDRVGTVPQYLTRSTLTRKVRVFSRILNKSTASSKWEIHFKGGECEYLYPSVTRLSDIKIPDNYYMTTDDTFRLRDHPSPGDAWLVYGCPAIR